MKVLALKYSHYHPAHSLILNTKDDAWKAYVSPQELHQIDTLNPIKLPLLPDSLKEYLLSYQGKKSIIHVTDLFLYYQLPATDDNEVGRRQALVLQLEKNMDRSTNEEGQLNRKVVGTKVDLVMKRGNLEYGCMETSCSDDPSTTKVINEGCIKLPRTLKDVLNHLTKEV
ncbi:hypothetical protein INT45_005139 [Circinella minor]|uniref:Uncharacterized protein n=1 Tax=Circinella minor TaxID=1195481 RepID=A0A8H7VD70_9FUNG|nr:hypothetical protein INT45_005139 [Circinella minor]